MQPGRTPRECDQKARGMSLLLIFSAQRVTMPINALRLPLSLCMPRAKSTKSAALSCNISRLMYVRSKEYKVALRWLSWLLTERRDDPGLWSIVGYVQLMLGDISVADRTFHKAAELLSAAQTPQQKQRNQAIVRRHQGLLLFARNDFAGQSECLLHLEALQWSVVADTNAYPARTGLLLGPFTLLYSLGRIMCFFLSFPTCPAAVALSSLRVAATWLGASMADISVVM